MQCNLAYDPWDLVASERVRFLGKDIHFTIPVTLALDQPNGGAELAADANKYARTLLMAAVRYDLRC